MSPSDLVKKNYRVVNKQENQLLWVGFILLHVPLALAMNSSRALSTIHGILTLAVCIYVALTARNKAQIGWAGAYICGAELLWRMTEARIFWEFGKYAIVLIFIIGLLRTSKPKNLGLPLLFFSLLTFSIPLTLYDLDLDRARQAISFNLSGPLSLAVSVMFFSQVSLDPQEREKLIWYLIAPILGIATLCVWGIATADELIFGTESNFAASGGYGPNQVSAMLGLGALLLILLAIQHRKAKSRLLPLGLALGLVTLSALTFSRGGLYNLAASLLVAGVFSFRNPRLRNTFFPVIIIAVLVGGFIVFPQLNTFTDGMLGSRFADTSTSGRTEILQAEIEVWKENPILGVGPGMGSYAARNSMGKLYAAHTEYSRILAEHGLLGIMSLLLLPIMGIRGFLRTKSGFSQIWMAALLVWPAVEMTHAAMRVAAIGFIFGLAFVMARRSPPAASDHAQTSPVIHR